jgi:hypothetical protein
MGALCLLLLQKGMAALYLHAEFETLVSKRTTSRKQALDMSPRKYAKLDYVSAGYL